MSGALLAVVAVLVVSGPTAAGRPDAADGVVEVEIGDNSFKPKRLRVPVGTTVVWRNDGRDEHNVLPDRDKRFGVDEIAQDATYSFRFDKPGRYGYHCSFHGAPRTGQFGVVKVKKS